MNNQENININLGGSRMQQYAPQPMKIQTSRSVSKNVEKIKIP